MDSITVEVSADAVILTREQSYHLIEVIGVTLRGLPAISNDPVVAAFRDQLRDIRAALMEQVAS